MLTALLSDIHSNLLALEACLAHARGRGATRFAFLGDLVGYGPEPGEVIDRIAGLEAEGAIVVKGNHDEAVDSEATSRRLHDLAFAAIQWTRERLSPTQRRFLWSLPLMKKVDDQCFVHASALQPGRWDYVEGPATAGASLEAAEATYVFSGHVHEPRLYFTTPAGKIAAFEPRPGSAVPVPRRRRWLAIVGSAGQPRDGNPAAAYALFDDEQETMTFFRVPYDHHAAAATIRSRGLPEALADRLEQAR